MTELSMGKLLNLRRLADGSGRFRMLAIDQRDSLRAALDRALRGPAGDISGADLVRVKDLITEVLAPQASAVLVDPVYGLPGSATRIPAQVGVLVALEETGYEAAGAGRERKTRLIEDWSVHKTKRAGANAVKLLIPYSPEASAEVRRHQQQIVQEAGEACAREDIPFLLELITHPIAEPSADTPDFAAHRPGHTIAAAAEFSQERYRVDILKLEFPGDLKYAREYASGSFDGKARPALYGTDDLRRRCRELDAAAGRPWVILSGGVDIAEFLVNLELAVEAGASGFLCGRAIWKGAIPRYPDLAAMRQFLETDGVANFTRANAGAARARPWGDHPVFGGQERLRPADAGEGWHRRYGEVPAPEP